MSVCACVRSVLTGCQRECECGELGVYGTCVCTVWEGMTNTVCNAHLQTRPPCVMHGCHPLCASVTSPTPSTTPSHTTASLCVCVCVCGCLGILFSPCCMPLTSPALFLFSSEAINDFLESRDVRTLVFDQACSGVCTAPPPSSSALFPR